MRYLFSFLLLGLLSVVQALSASGNKLLVILEDVAEKTKYSKYIKDLEGLGSRAITFMSLHTNSKPYSKRILSLF
jgi:oligosaccharyltransferase complex subunit beta